MQYKLYRDTERDQRDCRDCGDQWRYMQVQNCVERQRDQRRLKNTVQTRDTCKYKIDRDQRRVKRLCKDCGNGRYMQVQNRDRETKGDRRDCRDCGDEWRYIDFMER